MRLPQCDIGFAFERHKGLQSQCDLNIPIEARRVGNSVARVHELERERDADVERCRIAVTFSWEVDSLV